MPTPVFRRATARDVPAVVALLADDPLGATRETPDDLAPYLAAFAEVDGDPRHLLLVADDEGTVVGTLQLTLLPGLARRGALRARIEAVRVAASRRGDGLGATMVRYAVEARCSSSSPPTGPGPTPTGSTSGSASPGPTTGSAFP